MTKYTSKTIINACSFTLRKRHIKYIDMEINIYGNYELRTLAELLLVR